MIRQCALTKLAYLLSKSDRLSPNEIRKLICVPLRGEFTLPSSGNTDHSPSNGPIPETAESLPNILHQISRLSAPPPVLPTIQLTIPNTTTSGPLLSRSTSLSRLAKDVTSPWSNTVSETASTEAALFPFLVHLAVVRDDVDALRFCFDTSAAVDATPIGEPAHPIFSGGGVEIPQIFNVGLSGRGVTGGIVNVLDPASGRTPLHVAALNGSSKCAMLLLENGALVHLRDSLDHTALYYVSDHFRAFITANAKSAGYRRPGRGTNPLSTTSCRPVLTLGAPILPSCAWPSGRRCTSATMPPSGFGGKWAWSLMRQ